MANKNCISSGQKELAKLIRKALGIRRVILEGTWKWLVSDTGHNMYVDIVVPSRKLCVEYQGQQHYFFPNRFHKTYEDFMAQRKRDDIKRNLLKKHGFLYLSWKYSEKLSLSHVAKRLAALGLPLANNIVELIEQEEAAKKKTRKPRRSGRKMGKTKRVKKK